MLSKQKLYFISTLFLVLSSERFAFSQPQVLIGDQIQFPKSYFSQHTIGDSKSGYLVTSLSNDRQTFSFIKLDSTLRFVKRDDISTNRIYNSNQNFPSNAFDEFLFALKKRYFFVFSTWNSIYGKEYLFASELDINNWNFIGTAKELVVSSKLFAPSSFAEKLIKNGTWTTGGNNSKYKFGISSDSSKILVSYMFLPVESNDNYNRAVYGFHVFDDNMFKIWNGDFEMPYTEELMDVIDIKVSSNSEVIMLIKVYDRVRKISNNGLANYWYELLKFNPNSKQYEKLRIEIQGKFFPYPLLSIKESEIELLGNYSNTSGSNTDGILKVSVINFKSITLKTSTFHSVLKNIFDDKTDNIVPMISKLGAIANIKKIDLPDKGCYLLGEIQYGTTDVSYITTSLNFNYSKKSNNESVYYYGIVVSKLDSNGVLKWAKYLPKNQWGDSEPGFMSYASIYFNGRLNILYLDNSQNLVNSNSLKFYENGKKGILVCVELDENGIGKKTILSDLLKNNRFYITTLRKRDKNLMLGKIESNETGYIPFEIIFK